MNNVIIKRVTAVLLCICMVFSVYVFKIQADEEDVFYLYATEEGSGGKTRALPNVSVLPISNDRYDKFYCPEVTESTDECPILAMGIKYVTADSSYADGGGKSRYVYCLEVHKSTPEPGVKLNYSGWTDKKITYALYHGAVYYKEACRNSDYATGDWQLDYFVTQVAIHILNNEFTLAAFLRGISGNCIATQSEKDLVYDRVKKIVTDAKNTANYDDFTSGGWVDLSKGSFSLSGYSDAWEYKDEYYYSKGVFKANLTSFHGYDFKEQITKYSVSVPSGTDTERLGDANYADFRVKIANEQFKKWQVSGQTIPVNVEVSVPRYWGGKVFSPSVDTEFQKVCMFAWTSSGGQTTFSDSAKLHIKPTSFPRNLTIQKKIVASEVNWAHGNPIFFFEVSGTDVEGKARRYQTFIEFKKEDVTSQMGAYYVLETTIENIPSGVYTIKEEDNIARYILTDAGGLTSNVTVQKNALEKVNGLTKIEADVEADLTLLDGKVSFLNQKVLHNKFSDNAVIRNHFVVPD